MQKILSFLHLYDYYLIEELHTFTQHMFPGTVYAQFSSIQLLSHVWLSVTP